MDSSFDKSPGLNLPQPMTEASIGMSERKPETTVPESIPQTTDAPLSVPPPIVPVATPLNSPVQAASVQDDDGASVVPAVPVNADDTDLIEKEWVVKAKQIVDKTKQDPYMQTKQMSKFKAEYLSKRYNKEITVLDE